MYAPVLGPTPPGKKFLSDAAAERHAMDAFAFDESFRTFCAPAASLLKRRKYRRPEREKKGDPEEFFGDFLRNLTVFCDFWLFLEI